MTKIEELELEIKARKMVEGTRGNWWNVIRHRRTKTHLATGIESYSISDVELALGIIEGKPVWEGDELYCGDFKFTTKNKALNPPPGQVYSWNPPKLTIETFESWWGSAEASALGATHYPGTFARMGWEACRKALEEIK